eukprot:354342-Chlamydomonas_euryale.AAC.1
MKDFSGLYSPAILGAMRKALRFKQWRRKVQDRQTWSDDFKTLAPLEIEEPTQAPWEIEEPTQAPWEIEEPTQAGRVTRPCARVGGSG